MRLIPLFLLVLLLLSMAPANAIEINPSVDNQPFLCRYSITKWICETTGSGTGTELISSGNVTNIFNNSGTFTYTSDETNFFNYTTIFSEMNQTPNMTAGPEGPQGPPGNDGAANMTAGPAGEKGDTGDTGPMGPANMTAGPAGADGYTPIKGVDYFDGEDGAPGSPGAPGADGYTPIKGVDYFDGAKGDKGDTGDVGPMGPANMTAGPAGEKGDKGDPGEIPDSSQFLFLNGSRAMTGVLDMGTHNISNVVDPVTAQDAATKNYVDTRIPISFHAHNGSVDQGGFTNGGTVLVKYQTETFDNGGYYDAANSRFTPLVAGNYIIHARFRAAMSASKIPYLYIYKNGVSVALMHTPVTAAATSHMPDALVLVYLDGVDDYVEVFFSNPADTTRTIQHLPDYSYFEGYKL